MSLKKTIIFFWKWLVDCIYREISFGLPFLLVFVFFSIGIIFYFSLNQEPSWEQLIALVSAFLGIFYVLRSCRGMWFIVGFVLCIVLGVLAAKIETWRVSTSMLGSDIFTTLTGRVASIEPTGKRDFRIILDVLKTEKPLLLHGPNRVRLSARHLPYGLAIGDGLYGRVKILALSGPVRPGGYDFSFHNYFKTIGAQGVYLGKPAKVSVPQPETMFGTVLQKIENLRMNVTQKIRTAIGGENGRVAAALITGQRGGISYDTNEALRAVGLAHILSISGLHMALLGGIILFGVRGFLAFFTVFSSHYPVKKFAAVAALMVTAFYLLLSGVTVSAQRSFIMIAVMLVAVSCGRSPVTMRNFAVAGLITLSIAPHEILSPSFQMSFSATAALIAFFDWYNGRSFFRARKATPFQVGDKVVRFIFSSIASISVSSLVAGSVSGVYATYHFSNVAPLGIISNTLALPIMSMLIMPFGLIAVFAIPFGLEWLPLQIMGLGVGAVIKIARAIRNISPVLNPSFMPLSALILFTLGFVGLIFCRTGIRFFFSIFILAGIYVFLTYPPVQLIIANDMMLVGVINGEKLYTDRHYISKFTRSIWKKSFRVSEVVKPARYGPLFHGQFICDDRVCTSVSADGLRVVVLHGEIDRCVEADIVIKAFKSESKICDRETQIIFTLQELLLRGSVMMTKNGDIIWSSFGASRPWNMHRKYSQN